MKSPRCTICRHDERWRIELLRAGGASLDSLATKFAVERDAIHRHWHNHVPAETKASYLAGPSQLAELAAKAAIEGDSVLDYMRMLRTGLTAQFAACMEASDGNGAAYVAGRLTRVLESMARITGELGDLAQSTINITNNIAMLTEQPAFMKVQAALLKALAPYPDARGAVVVALQSLESEAPVHHHDPKVIEHHVSA